MISFFTRYKRLIFAIVVVIFIGSIFFVSGNVFTSSSMDAVAEVGGSKIPYQRFLTQVNRMLSNVKDSGAEINEAVSRNVKQEVFREMIIEELLSRQGAKMGMRVPDFEVAVEVQNTPQFQENGAFSPRAYYQTIFNEFQLSPSDYEAWRKKARLAAKFKQFIYTSVKVTPEEAKAYYLARNKELKNFEKERAGYAEELARDKFANITNYLLRQLITQQEVKDYLKLREQGR